MQVPIVNPTNKKAKKTQSIISKKNKNPMELVVVGNPTGKPSKPKHGSNSMPKKVKTKKPRPAGGGKPSVPSAKAAIRYVPIKTAQKGKKKKRKNPAQSSNPWVDMAKVAGGAVLGFTGAKVIGNGISKMIGADKAEPESMLAKAAPFIKPGVEAAATVAVGMIGEKVISDPLIRVGIFAGGAVAAVQDAVKAVAPGAAEWLNDAMGETTSISQDVFQNALEYAQVSDVEDSGAAGPEIGEPEIGETEIGDVGDVDDSEELFEAENDEDVNDADDDDVNDADEDGVDDADEDEMSEAEIGEIG